MGSPLPRDDRGPSRPEPGRTRVGPRSAPVVTPDAAGGLRRCARRPRSCRGPGCDALAAPGVARVLPHRRIWAFGAGRPRVVGPRGAGDALVDVARLHRAGDARPRLDGGAARAAGPVPLGWRGWRRDRGVGLRRHALRTARGAMAGRRRRAVRPPPRLHLHPGSQLRREGRAHRRSPTRSAAAGRRRRRTSRSGRTCWPRRWPTTAPPASSRSSSSPTVGTTSSTALDPLPSIADACAADDTWLHVDAAHAGSALVCPELRWIVDGVDRADSFCMNPHKWLFTNFDCDCFWVADRAALIGALTVLPEYLRNEASESGAVIDYRDWQVPLGRRFRALKLWFVLRAYGADGLRTMSASTSPSRRGWRTGCTHTRASMWSHRTRSTSCASATWTATPPRRRCSTRSTPPAACSSPTRGSTTAT